MVLKCIYCVCPCFTNKSACIRKRRRTSLITTAARTRHLMPEKPQKKEASTQAQKFGSSLLSLFFTSSLFGRGSKVAAQPDLFMPASVGCHREKLAPLCVAPPTPSRHARQRISLKTRGPWTAGTELLQRGLVRQRYGRYSGQLPPRQRPAVVILF